MARRRSQSQESWLSRQSLTQQPSLPRLSNPDVFSDDFALSSRGNSPVESSQGSSDHLPDHASSQPPLPQLSTVHPPSHLNTTTFSRPSSTAKRPLQSGEGLSVAPHRAISSVSHSDAATRRSLSVSSRFSIPRTQSPYTGPNAPTQQSTVYLQVTRPSSITSESTIQPVERPYVGTSGPEHPYAMYPQNTVDEEDGPTHGPQLIIPLGFPGMAQTYNGNQASGHDLGDIVGHDGHIEQLPPYSRYADNTIAKASNDAIPMPNTVINIPPSPTIATSSTTATSPTAHSDADLITVTDTNAGQPEYNEKSKAPRRLRRKLCWGVSLCVWLIVVGGIVIAAILGGVIGGVIGNESASEAASENGPTATTTVWLDAGPLPTSVPAPDCTQGAYIMPTWNNSLHTSSCISKAKYAAAWECLDEEPIPFSIKYNGQKPFITLGEDGPGKTQGFNYGAQAPDLNNSYYPLMPSIDKDDPNAGGAMFVALLFDKLTVVHPSDLYLNSKRSLNFADLEERTMYAAPVSQTDMPYFCWFNQTLLELFIYSNQSTKAAAANTTAYAYAYSSSHASSITSSSSPFTDSTSTSMEALSSSYGINQVASPTPTPPPSPPETSTYVSDDNWSVTSASWPPYARLAQRDDDDHYPIYNKQVRLAEKRAPQGDGDDVMPYCIQMGIREDWSVFPIEDTLIQIKEVEPAVSGASRRWNKPRSSNNNLDSDCACQWYST